MLIKIDHGDIFEGTQDQFRDCFFDNAEPMVIFNWAQENGWMCEIRGLEVGSCDACKRNKLLNLHPVPYIWKICDDCEQAFKKEFCR